MPRTAIDAGRDFEAIRYQRMVADRLRRQGKMREEEWAAKQAQLSPLDRRYFAERMTSENPLMAAPLLAAIPADYAAKKLGLMRGRSEASLDQMAEGYRGLGQGLVDWKDQVVARLRGQPASEPAPTPTRAWSSPEERRRILETYPTP